MDCLSDNFFQIVPNSEDNQMQKYECNCPLSLPNITADHHFRKMPEFCNADNVEQCIVYVSHELGLLGFPSICSENDNKIDAVKFINTMYELLQLHFKDVKAKEELERRNIRTSCDLDQAYISQSRLKESLQQNEYSIAAIQEKIRQLTVKLKNIQSQLKAEKDENKKLSNIIQQRHVQYHHEMRKKEREINNLKERLHQAITDKGIEKRFGMDIINALPRSSGQRGKWRTGTANSRNEEELHKLVVSTYESHQQELMNETCKLRECLEFLQDELISVIQQQQRFYEAEEDMTNHVDDSENNKKQENNVSAVIVNRLPSSYFQMPFLLVQRKIEDGLHQKWKYVKSYIKSLEEHIEKKGRKELEDGKDTKQEIEENGSTIKSPKEKADLKKEKMSSRIPYPTVKPKQQNSPCSETSFLPAISTLTSLDGKVQIQQREINHISNFNSETGFRLEVDEMADAQEPLSHIDCSRSSSSSVCQIENDSNSPKCNEEYLEEIRIALSQNSVETNISKQERK